MNIPLTPLRFLRYPEQQFPRKTAVVCGDKRFTYAEFGARVGQLAGVLHSLGVQTEDRVAFLSTNCHRLLEAYYGVLEAGVLEVKECSRRRAATRLVVAEVERWTVVRGPAANGKIEFRSCDVVPVEEDALHTDLIAVGHPCRGAIDIETIRLAVKDLHSGGVAEHLVHAEACTKADI